MGMYDSVKVSCPLPGAPPAFVRHPHTFQTKDLGCSLDEYEVTADGRLVLARATVTALVLDAMTDGKPPEQLAVPLDDYTGTICLYDSNVAASGPGLYTRDGADYESVAYRATVVNGRLTELVETHRERKPALPVARCGAHEPPPPTPEQIAERKRRTDESLVGRTMFLLWGGGDPESGTPVEIVAEGPRQWCGRAPDGELHVFHRFQRDTTLFDSKESAGAIRGARADAWEMGRREYEEYAERWRAERPGVAETTGEGE